MLLSLRIGFVMLVVPEVSVVTATLCTMVKNGLVSFETWFSLGGTPNLICSTNKKVNGDGALSKQWQAA